MTPGLTPQDFAQLALPRPATNVSVGDIPDIESHILQEAVRPILHLLAVLQRACGMDKQPSAR